MAVCDAGTSRARRSCRPWRIDVWARCGVPALHNVPRLAPPQPVQSLAVDPSGCATTTPNDCTRAWAISRRRTSTKAIGPPGSRSGTGNWNTRDANGSDSIPSGSRTPHNPEECNSQTVLKRSECSEALHRSAHPLRARVRWTTPRSSALTSAENRVDSRTFRAP